MKAEAFPEGIVIAGGSRALSSNGLQQHLEHGPRLNAALAVARSALSRVLAGLAESLGRSELGRRLVVLRVVPAPSRQINIPPLYR